MKNCYHISKIRADKVFSVVRKKIDHIEKNTSKYKPGVTIVSYQRKKVLHFLCKRGFPHLFFGRSVDV